MRALCLMALTVVIADQATKLMLRHVLGNGAFALGRCGSVRVVAGRMWLRRLARPCGRTIWCVWLAAAAALATVSALAPFNALFVGLLLGSSFSHAVESSLRGSITDYICLRNGAAFNLADLALAAGATGILGDLLIMMQRNLF
jgi:lipoprotein signal peptidase